MVSRAFWEPGETRRQRGVVDAAERDEVGGGFRQRRQSSQRSREQWTAPHSACAYPRRHRGRRRRRSAGPCLALAAHGRHRVRKPPEPSRPSPGGPGCPPRFRLPGRAGSPRPSVSSRSPCAMTRSDRDPAHPARHEMVHRRRRGGASVRRCTTMRAVTRRTEVPRVLPARPLQKPVERRKRARGPAGPERRARRRSCRSIAGRRDRQGRTSRVVVHESAVGGQRAVHYDAGRCRRLHVCDAPPQECRLESRFPAAELHRTRSSARRPGAGRGRPRRWP